MKLLLGYLSNNFSDLFAISHDIHSNLNFSTNLLIFGDILLVYSKYKARFAVEDGRYKAIKTIYNSNTSFPTSHDITNARNHFLNL